MGKHGISRRIGRLLAVSAGGFAFALAALADTSEDRHGEVAEYNDPNTGADPHAYKSAEEMYVEVLEGPYDWVAVSALRRIDAALAAGKSLEDDAVWADVLTLNRCRDTARLRAQLPAWAEGFAAQARTAPSPIPDADTVFSADSAYATTELKEGPAETRPPAAQAVADRYRNLVKAHPKALDIRNNLGLTLLHLGEDLAAELEWEVLRRLAPDYAPALVNLAVLHERAGRRVDAATVAEEGYRLAGQLPAAAYNQAWFQDISGAHMAAAQTLHPFANLPSRPKYGELYELIGHQGGIVDSSPVRGLMGLFRPHGELAANGLMSGGGLANLVGGRKTWGGWTCCVVGFGFASLILAVASAQISSFKRRGREGMARTAFLVLGGAWYILFWGEPRGIAWVAFAFFVLAGAGMAGAAARER